MPDTPAPAPDEGAAAPAVPPLARLSVDWWAVIVAGALVVLALAGALPAIGW
jgi:hypothetical protein